MRGDTHPHSHPGARIFAGNQDLSNSLVTTVRRVRCDSVEPVVGHYTRDALLTAASIFYLNSVVTDAS